MVFFEGKDVNGAPEVVGHRGWPSRFPDNTLTGFLAASTVVDAMETDIRRSGDGKLVLSHDPVLGGLEVATHPWSVLGEVDLGDGHRPALLDEVIAAMPSTPFQFEIKNLPYQTGFEPDHRLALETAERARPGDVVTSFNPDTILAVRNTFPDVTTGMCVGALDDLGDAVRRCLNAGHRVLIPSIEHSILDLARAVETGLALYPWVVDEPDRVDELVSLGASGIITDDPAAIRAALRRDQ
jgi:glycerophosphoryl diester phosphodiesterase